MTPLFCSEKDFVRGIARRLVVVVPNTASSLQLCTEHSQAMQLCTESRRLCCRHGWQSAGGESGVVVSVVWSPLWWRLLWCGGGQIRRQALMVQDMQPQIRCKWPTRVARRVGLPHDATSRGLNAAVSGRDPHSRSGPDALCKIPYCVTLSKGQGSWQPVQVPIH